MRFGYGQILQVKSSCNRPLSMFLSQHRIKQIAGQSLIESCIAIGIICLFLMGLFQLSQLYMAQEILTHAAGRGARAKTVGMNDFMVRKTVQVATIPSVGRLLERPNYITSPTAQRSFERARIPLYLEEPHPGRLSAVLNYTNWPTIDYSLPGLWGPELQCRVNQNFPIQTVIFRAFYRNNVMPLSSTVSMENHYPLYLQ